MNKASYLPNTELYHLQAWLTFKILTIYNNTLLIVGRNTLSKKFRAQGREKLFFSAELSEKSILVTFDTLY
jgi:hypothetical protein